MTLVCLRTCNGDVGIGTINSLLGFPPPLDFPEQIGIMYISSAFQPNPKRRPPTLSPKQRPVSLSLPQFNRCLCFSSVPSLSPYLLISSSVQSLSPNIFPNIYLCLRVSLPLSLTFSHKISFKREKKMSAIRSDIQPGKRGQKKKKWPVSKFLHGVAD